MWKGTANQEFVKNFSSNYETMKNYVDVITMGPPQAKSILYEAFAMSADEEFSEGVFVEDCFVCFV